MTKRVVPSDFRTHLIEQIIESVEETANTVYYGFIGDHVSSDETQSGVLQPTSRLQDLNVESFRNMILGKRLTQDNFRIVIPRNMWEANTVYDMYDDLDEGLGEKEFFVAVDETAFIHVYKCLSNANGAMSTIEPRFHDVKYDPDLPEAGDSFYETADGYQWKYMFSVDSQTFDNFATEKYMPFVANTVIKDNAQNGSIDVIKVDSHGRFYNNSIDSDFTRLAATGDSTIFRLPTGSSEIEDFYANTIFHLTEGRGAGQYRRVTTSFANSSGTFIQLEEDFDVQPDTTTKVELTPEVAVTSDGTQTVNVVARAIVNTNASNSIHRVEVLNPGLGYNYGTAEILVGSQGPSSNGTSGELVEVEAAEVRPIIPPPGGHGFDGATELNGRGLAIFVEFNQSEGNTVPAENTFAQFGIIRDPLFANVEMTFVKPSDNLIGSDGTFIKDEVVTQFKKKRLFGTFEVTDGNNIISSTDNLDLQSELDINDSLYLIDETNADYQFFTTVNTVINSTAIQINDEPDWNSSNTTLYYATPTANAVINESLFGMIRVRDCDQKFVDNRLIVGRTSQTFANVQTINVNDRLANGVYDFSAYNQMTVIAVAGDTSAFTNLQRDERLYQEDSGAEGYLHSYEGNRIFLTRVAGVFDEDETIVAEDSGVTVSDFEKYNGELDLTAGNIIYLQNDIPVSRDNNRSEEIRVILEF